MTTEPVSISAVAVRFGGWLVHHGGIVAITPIVRHGHVVDDRFRSPDKLTAWEMEMSPPVAKVPSSWPMPFEIWSKNIRDTDNGPMQDEERPWIYFQMPLVTWKRRNGQMLGKGQEGPVLRTEWLIEEIVRDTTWLGGWIITDIPPPTAER